MKNSLNSLYVRVIIILSREQKTTRFSFSLFLRERARVKLSNTARIFLLFALSALRDVEKNCGRGLFRAQKCLVFTFRVVKKSSFSRRFVSLSLSAQLSRARGRTKPKKIRSKQSPYCRHVLFFFLCASLSSLFLVPPLVVVVRSSFCAKKCR